MVQAWQAHVAAHEASAVPTQEKTNISLPEQLSQLLYFPSPRKTEIHFDALREVSFEIGEVNEIWNKEIRKQRTSPEVSLSHAFPANRTLAKVFLVWDTSHVCATMNTVEKETLFGYEIPMPRSDLFIALATVICFLPVTVIIYQSVMWVKFLSYRKQKRGRGAYWGPAESKSFIWHQLEIPVCKRRAPGNDITILHPVSQRRYNYSKRLPWQCTQSKYKSACSHEVCICGIIQKLLSRYPFTHGKTQCSAVISLQGSSEIFFRKVRFWDQGGKDAPPVFAVDGVNYLHTKVVSAYCKSNMLSLHKLVDSPAFIFARW